jgi:hypothetical protein
MGRKQCHNYFNPKIYDERDGLTMLWYEPCGSPADWAIKHSGDIDSLVNKWENCKYNPSVLRAFIMDEDFNWNKFAIILTLYEDHTKFKDLLLICFEKLKIFVNSNIEWKFSKISEEDSNKCKSLDPELLSTWLQLSFLCDAEPTQIILNNYPDISEYLKNFTVGAILKLYELHSTELNPSADCYVDHNYAENVIKEIVKNTSKTTTRMNNLYDFEGTPFTYFVCNLLDHDNKFEALAHTIIFDTIDEYYRRENHKVVSNVCPYVTEPAINDIYDTINCVANKQEASQMIISLLADKSLCCDKDTLCKVSKLCINNINHNYGDCISKSCEESILNGIQNFDNYIVSIGMFDIDECITAIEAIQYGIDVVTEAKRDVTDEEPEEPTENEEFEEEPTDEMDRHTRENPSTAEKKNPAKRDFDAEYRKFKKNAKNVDLSLTKILSTIKGFLTGTSETRGVRKATGTDSVAQILARVFGTIAVFHVSKFLGILFVVVRLANSGKVTRRERAKIVSEIKTEIEVIDSQLNDGSIENAEAKQNLIRTKRNLEDALRKIEQHRGNQMSEGSKQAVRDIIDRR